MHVRIGPRLVGNDQPCLVVAEAGVNHNGQVELACRMVEAAAAAGADAVKFQTFQADRLVTRSAPKAEYQLQTTDPAESQYDMLRRLELSEDAHRTIAAACEAHGILFLSTPFDTESADFLAGMPVSAIKIPSGEITNLPFLADVGRHALPMIVSTGMSTLDEVRTALETIAQNGNPPVILLHCVSRYPAEPADVNLRAMATMASVFQVPVGYSDHTLGLDVPTAAVALGACVVEKHFTLDRTLPGPDHRASLEPGEFAALIRSIRTVEAALGDGRKVPVASERDTAAAVRKSLVIARDVKAGARLTDQDIAIKRPGTGLAPALKTQIVGRKARVDIAAGTLATFEMLA